VPRHIGQMTDTPPESLIPYDEIVQESLREVVKQVLRDIQSNGGLPGAHHFYIAFRTKFPGVEIPKHLSERYPEEMTVVVQHRYWDLSVDPDSFTIGLSFNQVPAKLVIPWKAISGFVDPSVNFALQFAVTMPDMPAAPAPPPEPVLDGSNVVTLDRFRKK
jgi:uncharacterized protein